MNLPIQWITWNYAFVDMMKNLGSYRAENYKEWVGKLLKGLENIRANMSIKVHFYTAIKMNFRKIAAMWEISKENDSLRYQNNGRALPGTNIKRHLTNVEYEI